MFARQWFIFAWLLLSGCLHVCMARETLDLRLRLRVDQAQRVWVDVGGSSVQVRMDVQEWSFDGAQADAEKADAQAGANTVGSIVEHEALREVMARLAWSSEAEEPEVKTLEQGPDCVIQEYAWAGREAALRVTWAISQGRLVASGQLCNESQSADRQERRMTLGLSAGVPAQGGRWFQDAHTEYPLNDYDEFLLTFPARAGVRGSLSRYPLAVVQTGPIGLAAALPIDRPCIHRMSYDGPAQMLRAQMDVALSPRPWRFSDRVDFEFWLLAFDPAWGMRGALQKYYELSQGRFEDRAPRQGQWMPFSQIDQVKRPEDFRFVFHEYHPNISVAYDNANDIQTLVYCEPPVQYIDMPKGMTRDLEHFNALVDSLQTEKAWVVRSSGAWDAQGNLIVQFADLPWSSGGRVATNCDPDVMRTASAPMNAFDLNWKPYRELREKMVAPVPAAWTVEGGPAASVDNIAGMNGARALLLGKGARISQVITDSVEAGQVLTLTMRALALGPEARAQAGVIFNNNSDEPSVDWLELECTQEGWREWRQEVTVPEDAGACRLVLKGSAGECAVDGIRLAAGAQSDKNLITNGGFEATLADEQACDGLYLDSLEGWESPYLNHRPEHLVNVDFPLTFDAMSGDVGQVVLIHNMEFVRDAAQRLRRRGALLMANTALYHWCWPAAWLDVMGIETNWGTGPAIVPPSVEEMDFVRAMCGERAYCYLQNVAFDKFRGQKVVDYFERCLHYGFWPGFFSVDAASSPYWEDARLYDADRGVYLKYMDVQGETTQAGWQPVTLAHCSDPLVLTERWGGGSYDGQALSPQWVYFTVYNPTERKRTVQVSLDEALWTGRAPVVFDRLGGYRLPVSVGERSASLTLEPGRVGVLWAIDRDAQALGAAFDKSNENVRCLLEKWTRHGMIAAPQTDAVERAVVQHDADAFTKAWSEVEMKLEPLYREEAGRAARLLRALGMTPAEREALAGFEVKAPAGVSAGVNSQVEIVWCGAQPGPACLQWAFGDEQGEVDFTQGRALVSAPTQAALGTVGQLNVVRAQNGARVVYPLALPVVEAVSFLQMPSRLTGLEGVRLECMIENNTNAARRGRISVQAPQGVEPTWTAQELTLEPGVAQTVSVELNGSEAQREDELTGEVQLVWEEDEPQRRFMTPAVELVLLGKGSSRLRNSDIQVQADSTYFGYTTRPLTDGVIDTAQVDWSQAAWASDEGMQAHWVQFNFPNAIELEQVCLWWAQDGGSFFTSRHVLIQSKQQGDVEWRTLAEHTGGQATEKSCYSFPPAKVDRLRIYQPAGGGPQSRPGLLWLAEVEAR